MLLHINNLFVLVIAIVPSSSPQRPELPARIKHVPTINNCIDCGNIDPVLSSITFVRLVRSIVWSIQLGF